MFWLHIPAWWTLGGCCFLPSLLRLKLACLQTLFLETSRPRIAGKLSMSSLVTLPNPLCMLGHLLVVTNRGHVAWQGSQWNLCPTAPCCPLARWAVLDDWVAWSQGMTPCRKTCERTCVGVIEWPSQRQSCARSLKLLALTLMVKE